MDRAQKQSAILLAMAESFRKLLIKEFEKELSGKHSAYLSMRRAEDHKGRTDTIRSMRGVSEDEIEIVDLEKQTRRLCDKLNESFPIPLQVLDKYVGGCKRIKAQQYEREVKKSRLDEPTRSALLSELVDSWYMGGLSGGEHQHLMKTMLDELGRK